MDWIMKGVRVKKVNAVSGMQETWLSAVDNVRGEVHTVGRVTFAKASFNGRVARAVALCHPDDQYDTALGVDLAMSRALKRLGRDLARQANREVNRRGRRKYTQARKRIENARIG